jgi:hypothetical protein
MEQYRSTYPPEDPGAPRRGLFSRRSEAVVEVRPSFREADRLAAWLQRTVDDRLDEGIQAIEEQATGLMREIAAEMWRASAADVRPEQERIVSLLSRDQAIKSLVASSDERFQALALRTARLEDALGELAETGRSIRGAIERSTASIREIAESPGLEGIVDPLRAQVEEVERQILSTFERLDEHDHALAERLERMAEEHAAVARDDDSVTERVRPLEEQLDVLYERVGIQGRSMQELQGALERLVEARTYGLAQLIRSDSQVLRRLIDERAESRDSALRSSIEDRISELARVTEEQVAALTLGISAAIERNFARLIDGVAADLGSVAETVAQRAADAADVAVSSAFDRTIQRLDASISSIGEVGRTHEGSPGEVEQRMAKHVDDRVSAIARLIRSDNRVLASKMAASPATDGDADTTKRTLRAVKELQASLAGDVERRFSSMAEQLHRETQSTAEAMVKLAEVMGDRLDRLSVKIDEGYGNDLQIVIDRMSDAIQAMGRGRRQGSGGD